MKKLLLLFTLGVLLSCDIGDDDSINFTSEVMSIESVELPSEFIFGENYEIKVNYTRPSTCFEFQRILINPDVENSRTVAVIDTRYFDNSCQQIISNASVSFNFSVSSNETQVFQFFQGIVDGEDQYLIVEVPVVE